MLDDIASAVARLDRWGAISFAPPSIVREQSFQVKANAPSAIIELLEKLHFDPSRDEIEARRFAGDDIKFIVRQRLDRLVTSQ